MLCQSCHSLTSKRVLCVGCRRRMRPAPDRLLRGGVRVIAAFEHSGPARVLAHHLKYRGVIAYADVVAAMLAHRIPKAPLVPIPRARSRRFRYGVDPALALARRLSSHAGVPVLQLFSPPLHTQRRAGGDHRRPVSRPALLKTSLEKVTLIDDVLTTGATMEAAISAVGHEHVVAAVVANAVPELPSVRRDPTVAP